MKKWVMLAWTLALVGNGLASDDEFQEDGQRALQLVNYAAGVHDPSYGIEIEDGERYRFRSQASPGPRVYVWGNFGGVDRRGEQVDIEQVVDKIMGMEARGRAAGERAQVREIEGTADDDSLFVKGEAVQASDFDLPGVFDEDDHNWYGRDPRHPGTIYTQAKIRGFGKIYRDDPEARRERGGANGGGMEEVVAAGPDTKVSSRGQIFAKSLLRMLPPLAMATTGIILMEVVKGQPLTPNPSYWWISRHFVEPKFLFQTALFSDNVTIGRMIDYSWSYYDISSQAMRVSAWKAFKLATDITLLWAPAVIIAVGEPVRTSLWRKVERNAQNNSYVVGAAKVISIVACSVGSTLLFLVNLDNYSQIFTYLTPRLIQEMNLTSAIEFCKSLPGLYMAGQDAPNSFFEYPCDAHSLTQQMMPTASGLVWSLCESAKTTITSGNLTMLLMPYVFMFLQWMYLVLWM